MSSKKADVNVFEHVQLQSCQGRSNLHQDGRQTLIKVDLEHVCVDDVEMLEMVTVHERIEASAGQSGSCHLDAGHPRHHGDGRPQHLVHLILLSLTGQHGDVEYHITASKTGQMTKNTNSVFIN